MISTHHFDGRFSRYSCFSRLLPDYPSPFIPRLLGPAETLHILYDTITPGLSWTTPLSCSVSLRGYRHWTADVTVEGSNTPCLEVTVDEDRITPASESSGCCQGGHPAVEIWLKILPRKSYLHRVPKIHFHFLQYIWFLLTDFSNFLVIAIRNGQRVYLSLLIAIFQVNLGQIVTVNKSTPNSLQTGCPSRR